MKRAALIAVFFLLGVALGGWLGFRYFKAQIQPQNVRVDTLIIRDTFVREKPVFMAKRVIDTAYLPADTIRIRDSVFVPMPIEQRVYEDSTYRAVVSGWHPSLDTISVYRSTIVVERPVVVKLRPRWSVGVQAGTGVTLTDGRFRAAPYIGAGIQYNFINFGYDKRRNQSLD